MQQGSPEGLQVERVTMRVAQVNGWNRLAIGIRAGVGRGEAGRP